MKTFTDPITGKKFQLGKLGVDPLLERVKDYVAGREETGVSEVSLVPSKMEAGDTYRCGSCGQEFEFDGGNQDTFVGVIKEHGRGHGGACQIMPVL